MRKNTIHNKHLAFRLPVILAAMLIPLFSPLGTGTVQAGQEIYVAGAPDEWPVEYYDKKSETYRGVLPDLLEMAGSKAGIKIHYIEPSGEDNRISLAKNIQVDAVSTVGLSGEELSRAGLKNKSVLLTYTRGGEKQEVGLAYTKSMPDSVRQEFINAYKEIPEADIQGLYLDAMDSYGQYDDILYKYRAVILSVIAILAVIFLLLFIQFRRKKRQIEKLAYEDDMTGRSNFVFWKQAYLKTIVEGNREHYAVLYLDAAIEQVAHIYGYAEAGDALKLISDTCDALIEHGREEFARFNEFSFVFFVQYTNIEKLKLRVEEMENDIERVFTEKKKKYFLDIHTGIYRLSGIDTDPLKAVQLSEITEEYARNQFQATAVYDEFVEQKTVSGYALEHEAIHGLIHQEFLIYLQPVIDLRTGKICAAEALVRWQNPNRGLLKPDAFLNVMKRKNLTGKMNMEIYRQGIRFLKSEQEKGHRIQMLFNFTVENIGDKHFPDELRDTAVQCGVDPSAVIVQMNQIVEITKSGVYAETIRRLRAYGFDVCIAGLELDRVFFSYLEAGINQIKLRHELISQSDNSQGEILLKGITRICRKLGMKMLGVGVESKKQAERLKKLGCEAASGYYYYYPLSESEFAGLLDKGV